MTENDIWRSAHILHSHCGNDAIVIATHRADVLLDRGDATGSCYWIRIAEAIAELNRKRPDQGDTVH